MTEVLSYRNQFIDLQSTSMGCFLHDRELGHEKVKCFPQFQPHQIYKHQNLTSTLVFTIIFGIYTFTLKLFKSFSLRYLFDCKFADLMIFSLLQWKICAPEEWMRLRGFALLSAPIGIGRAICLGLIQQNIF